MIQCVYVREREREEMRESDAVIVCVRERERERERERVMEGVWKRECKRVIVTDIEQFFLYLAY